MILQTAPTTISHKSGDKDEHLNRFPQSSAVEASHLPLTGRMYVNGGLLFCCVTYIHPFIIFVLLLDLTQYSMASYIRFISIPSLDKLKEDGSNSSAQDMSSRDVTRKPDIYVHPQKT